VRWLLPAFCLWSCNGDVFASDNFDYDRAGWELEGQTVEARPRLDKTHGDPTGNICASDAPDTPEDRPWRFVAPPAYSGNASGFYRRRITWDAKTTNAQPSYLITTAYPPLVSNAIFIGIGSENDGGFVIGAPPDNNATAATDWTPLSVTLDTTSGWSIAQPDGGAVLATEDDIRRVLSNINLFNIRGEWSTDPEEACIDNIVFGAR
jgi:hypothetical protein